MKRVTCALGVALLPAVCAPAVAEIHIQVTVNSTDPWLVQNGLMSAVIALTGFENGQAVQGLHGFHEFPWQVSTTAPGGFFNIDSIPRDRIFDGEQPFAAAPFLQQYVGPSARWDSGLLPATPGASPPFGAPYDDNPNEEVGNFARFSDGSSENFAHVGWITLAVEGVPVNSTPVIPVMGLTWPGDHSATVAFTVDMNTPMMFIDMSVQILPAVTPCPADVNGDGGVNILDLLAVVAAWGTADASADVNNDGTVNITDLLAVVSAWGSCT